MEVLDSDIGKRVDLFLFEKLKDLPVSRTFLVENWNDFILINDRSVKPSYKIRKDDIYFIDTEKVQKLLNAKSKQSLLLGEHGNIDILYEDDNCLVINKQSGVVVHPGVGNEEGTLANFVKGYLEQKQEFDPNIKRAGVVHRLDKGVSGLILFAKNTKAQNYFQKQFENHTVEKIYRAKIECSNCSKEFLKYFPKKKLDIQEEIEKLERNNFVCDERWMKIEGYIGRDSVNRMKMHFTKYERGGSKYALTYIRPVSSNEILVKIATGRMHQIRCTLEYLGANIEGDTLYKTKSGKGGIPEKISLSSIFISLKNLNGDNLRVSLF